MGFKKNMTSKEYLEWARDKAYEFLLDAVFDKDRKLIDYYKKEYKRYCDLLESMESY